MQSHALELFADYFQFYLQDETAEGDLSDGWDEAAVARMLAIAPGVVGLGTVRNMTVPVNLELLDAEPAEDFDDFDHVVEGTLVLQTGPLVVAGCTDYFPDALRFDLEPGTYRVRMSCAELGTLSEDGLDGQDRYRMQLWLAPAIAPTVLKQWVTRGSVIAAS